MRMPVLTPWNQAMSLHFGQYPAHVQLQTKLGSFESFNYC